MLKLSAKLQAPRLDVRGYKNELERRARETISLAIFQYVETATSIIPVWSGASLATFTELAALISLPLVITPSDTAHSDETASGKTHGGAYLDIDKEGGRFQFVYQTDLPHLVWNEYHNANSEPDPGLFGKLKNPGPYHFQKEAGKEVYHVFQRFQGPSVDKYIKVKRVK